MKKNCVLRVILPIAYKNHPALFIGVNIWGIAQALSNAVHMIGLANLIDVIVAVIGKQSDLYELGRAIVWYGLALLFLQCANSIFNFLLEQYLDSCQGVFLAKFHQAVSKMEPIEFEAEEALNHLTKLKEGVSSSGIFTLYLFGVVDLVLPYFIFTGTYFAFVDIKLILCVLFAFIPACFSLFAQLKLYSKLQDTVAPIQRRYQNYKEYLVDKKFLKETRSLGAFSFFENKALKELKTLVREKMICNRKSQKISMTVNLVTVIGYAAMLVMLMYSIINGDISIGLFVAAYSSMETFFELMQNLIGGFGYGLTRVYEPVKELAAFLERKIPAKETGSYCIEKGIQTENVTFYYPNTAVPALTDINLEIPKGQILAVVGENGSGKSTLAKLLLGIYKPQTGVVRVGGNDTCMTEPQAYVPHLSAVFQDFGKYKLTLDENVKISQLDKGEDISSVLEDISLDKKVVLSRDFDGIELSGGQWQQVAIARAKYRNHDVIILDEPTAAIDPIKEAEIYEQFVRMSKGKTAVIITHRLGAARLAERILVLKEGRIVQDGTHEELVQREGEYSRMWKLQAQNYVRTEETTNG